jgi:YYY domain-containing protein
MIVMFVRWYLIVQLITLAALPLTVSLFSALPGRGYAFAKSLGILVIGFTLWLGTSFGLLRNEQGGVWLALLLLVMIGLGTARHQIRARHRLLNWRYVLTVEVIFLLGFAAWAVVRAYDPAADHTEQPMDLMFMNSIWSSPTYPPQDAWLGGYPISYYYFGYWLLTTVGRLAGQPPEIAYNLGQANWFAMLLLGSFGIGYNLLAHGRGRALTATLGGLLSMVAVAMAGNLQVVLEWLYAMGAPIEGLARRLGVNGFPEFATRSGDWYIGSNWWWWRSSRVIEDQDLFGRHIEVIDEFPMFSYLLGDNHPHVLAMPFVLLSVAMILNFFFYLPGSIADGTGRRLISLLPLGGIGLLLLTVALGSLIFLNTWDFPPYWLLAVLAFAVGAYRLHRRRGAETGRAWQPFVDAALFGLALVIGTLLLFLPYFLTAQSQAGGIVPNLFYPTRLPQFLIMFGPGMVALIALIGLSLAELRGVGSHFWKRFALIAALVYGLPLLFLLANALLATQTGLGLDLLARVQLPDGDGSHLTYMFRRWSQHGGTFVVLGGLLAAAGTLIRQYWDDESNLEGAPATLFALLMAGVGLLLLYAPEFVYLRDNFGTRMNTVFKFYYQGWLLIGLSGSYAVVGALRQARHRDRVRTKVLLSAPAVVALGLILLGLLFPLAGVYSKTNGFRLSSPTFDATAYLQQSSPAEFGAVAWIRDNTSPQARVAEAKGASYRADTSRISAMTGRPTLLGWDGHESQWRGSAYAEMARMRPETLEQLYRSGSMARIEEILTEWDIDYVYVGPSERSEYGLPPQMEERFVAVMDLAFEQDNVRIYRRRGLIENSLPSVDRESNQ